MKTLKERAGRRPPNPPPAPKTPSLILRGRAVDLHHTHLMGILNTTPDSFSDGGRFLDSHKAVDHLYRLVADGATFVDVGGESSRPGSRPISLAEELKRIEPVLSSWAKEPKGILSVDTTKAAVAEAALRHGASLINDITALRREPGMADVIASHGAGVILMHMQGTPETMQEAPRYTDVVGDILSFLEEAMDRACRAGIAEEAILLDPGIGFGKTVGQNLEILRHLRRFQLLGRPLVVGTSRKSFIGKLLDQPVDGSTSLTIDPEPSRRIEERIWGTAATVAFAVVQGVQILRVHDVAPMRQVVLMTEAILHGESP